MRCIHWLTFLRQLLEQTSTSALLEATARLAFGCTQMFAGRERAASKPSSDTSYRLGCAASELLWSSADGDVIELGRIRVAKSQIMLAKTAKSDFAWEALAHHPRIKA